jgi:F-type H+-transporting ATPase subunit delta
MVGTQIARRYAKALLALGQESSSTEQLVDEIGRIADAYKTSPELGNTLGHPLVPYAAKRAILTELADRLGLGQIAKNTVLLLNERRRMHALPAIAGALREMNDANKGIVRAEVASATPLAEDYYRKLHSQLEKMTGKRVVLDKRTDPQLIAGIVTRIGDTVYDGSLATRLQEMRNALAPA